MADRFLNSAGGNSAPYETSANAATTLSGLLAGATVAAGEKIWVRNTAVTIESSTATVVLTSEGDTPSNPANVICCGDWDDNPSTLSDGAIISTTGNYGLSIAGNWLFYGVTFNPCRSGTVGSSAVTIVGQGTNGPHHQQYIGCDFVGMGHVASHPLALGNNANTGNDPTFCFFQDCELTFGSASQFIRAAQGRHRIAGLSVAAASSAPNTLLATSAYSEVDVDVVNSDLSSVAIGALVDVSNGFSGTFSFRGCKFHAVTTITTGAWPSPGGEVLVINCDSGDTYTRHERHGYEGVWSVQPTIYATTNPADMSSGASDSYSIKMVSSANVSKHLPLYSQWTQVWNDGAAYTPSIEVLVGSDGAAALNVNELWLEVDYNSGTDSPLGTRVTTKPGLLDASTTAVAAGTTAWTGDGYTTERTHQLSTSAITPDKPGWIYMRVALAKPSTTIYVNPPR